MELEKIGSVNVSDMFDGLDPEVLGKIERIAEASRLRGGIEHVMHFANHLNTLGDELHKNPPEGAPENEVAAVLDTLGGVIKVMDEYVENCVEDYNKLASEVMYGATGEN